MKNLILKLFGGKKTAKQQEPAQPTTQITEQPFTVNNGGILGAILGDIAGSRFEFRNEKSINVKLFTAADKFTDDTVMTIAVAEAYYGIPDWMIEKAVKYLPADMIEIINRFDGRELKK